MKPKVRVAIAILIALATGSLTKSAVNGDDDQHCIQCRKIRADLQWQGTGIMVNRSDFICVPARGLWSHGHQGIQVITPFYEPRGSAKDEPNLVPEVVARTGALIAKIGDHGSFVVEDQLCFVPLYRESLCFP